MAVNLDEVIWGIEVECIMVDILDQVRCIVAESLTSWSEVQ